MVIQNSWTAIDTVLDTPGFTSLLLPIVAIVVWFLVWGFLEWRWGRRAVAMSRINRVSLALLVLSILLTFPSSLTFYRHSHSWRPILRVRYPSKGR
jgi:multisubunit Na+/H+ antiporter MnhB subunit